MVRGRVPKGMFALTTRAVVAESFTYFRTGCHEQKYSVAKVGVSTGT